MVLIFQCCCPLLEGEDEKRFVECFFVLRPIVVAICAVSQVFLEKSLTYSGMNGEKGIT